VSIIDVVKYKNKEDEELAERLFMEYNQTIEKIKKIKKDINLLIKELLKTNKNASERREGPYPSLQTREGSMERTF
jgi:hypothetical protein